MLIHGERPAFLCQGDDENRRELVARGTEDELLELEANGDCGECSAYFFPDQANELCRAAGYVYDSHYIAVCTHFIS